MTRFRTTYKHRDLGNVELVVDEDLNAETPEEALSRLSKTKAAYITYTKIEKVESTDLRKFALEKATELAKGKNVSADRVLEVAEEQYQFLTKK